MKIVICGTWPFFREPCEAAVDRLKKAELHQQETIQTPLSDVIIDAIEAVELNPNQPTVGAPGSVPNARGVYELDAAIMHSVKATATGSCCGAVLGLQDFRGAIRVANEVALHSPHSVIVGEGGKLFALAAAEKNLRVAALYDPKQNQNQQPAVQQHEQEQQHEQQHHSDTLGVVALRFCEETQTALEIVAAVASSGLARKNPGRVGDSALFGSGIYSDRNVGACVATGDGDAIALFPISFFVVMQMRMRHGISPSEACDLAIEAFLNDENVKNFVARKKQSLSEGGPLVALCAVNAKTGQCGGGSCKNWKCEFKFVSAEVGSEAEAAVRIVGF